MKLIEQSAWKYLSVKLPILGAFLLLVVIPALQWAMDFKVIPTEYHATITGIVMVWLSWFGRKIYQPGLHQNSALGVVAVTAGHSNSDPGAVNGSLKESDFVVTIRNALAYYLKEAGVQVKTDGIGLQNDPLSSALKLIKGTSVALEIHMNAAANKSAEGIETISLPKDKKLAQDVSKAVQKVTGSRLRGDNGWIDQSKSARGKLAFVSNGGLILEVGFISNDTEALLIQSKAWLIAKEILKVLIEYEKIN